MDPAEQLLESSLIQAVNFRMDTVHRVWGRTFSCPSYERSSRRSESIQHTIPLVRPSTLDLREEAVKYIVALEEQVDALKKYCYKQEARVIDLEKKVELYQNIVEDVDAIRRENENLVNEIQDIVTENEELYEELAETAEANGRLKKECDQIARERDQIADKLWSRREGTLAPEEVEEKIELLRKEDKAKMALILFDKHRTEECLILTRRERDMLQSQVEVLTDDNKLLRDRLNEQSVEIDEQASKIEKAVSCLLPPGMCEDAAEAMRLRRMAFCDVKSRSLTDCGPQYPLKNLVEQRPSLKHFLSSRLMNSGRSSDQSMSEPPTLVKPSKEETLSRRRSSRRKSIDDNLFVPLNWSKRRCSIASDLSDDDFLEIDSKHPPQHLDQSICDNVAGSRLSIGSSRRGSVDDNKFLPLSNKSLKEMQYRPLRVIDQSPSIGENEELKKDTFEQGVKMSLARFNLTKRLRTPRMA